MALIPHGKQEAVEVAVKKGVFLAEHGEVYDKMFDRVLSVAQATAANRSSMLTDVERGRKTEIDAINGYIVREGEKLGISPNTNKDMVRLIRELSHRSACLSFARSPPPSFASLSLAPSCASFL